MGIERGLKTESVACSPFFAALLFGRFAEEGHGVDVIAFGVKTIFVKLLLNY